MKTIKQIADEIGVSRQAVYKKIKKEPLSTSLQELTTKSDNGLLVSSQGEAVIKSAFIFEPQSTVYSQPQSTVDCEIITLLKENLTVLQSQLAEKDKQIADLTEAVKSQAQSINADRHNELAGTIQQQLIAAPPEEKEADKELEAELTDEPAADEQAPPKQGRLGRAWRILAGKE